MPKKGNRLPQFWGAWFHSFGGDSLKETNLNIFYNLGANLHTMKIATGMDGADFAIESVIPRMWLESFLSETEAVNLKESRALAQRLLDAVDAVYAVIRTDFTRKLTQEETTSLHRMREDFESAFEREAKNLNVFTVTQKGIYSLQDLIEKPEEKFSAEARKYFPSQMLIDLKQAGRCLAFEVPTACAFHVCRATEALMLKYHEVLSGKPWSFKKKDWKIYIEQLVKQGAPPAITNRLEEIRNLDRNSYIHPDVNVSLEEAPVLFELCTGVIFLMAKEIQRKVSP